MLQSKPYIPGGFLSALVKIYIFENQKCIFWGFTTESPLAVAVPLWGVASLIIFSGGAGRGACGGEKLEVLELH